MLDSVAMVVVVAARLVVASAGVVEVVKRRGKELRRGVRKARANAARATRSASCFKEDDVVDVGGSAVLLLSGEDCLEDMQRRKEQRRKDDTYVTVRLSNTIWPMECFCLVV